jgi:hypothetical protein
LVLGFEGGGGLTCCRINVREAEGRYPWRVLRPKVESAAFPQISSLGYHEALGQMFVTSRLPTLYPGISYFKPRILESSELLDSVDGDCRFLLAWLKSEDHN